MKFYFIIFYCFYKGSGIVEVLNLKDVEEGDETLQ